LTASHPWSCSQENLKFPFIPKGVWLAWESPEPGPACGWFQNHGCARIGHRLTTESCPFSAKVQI
jgi:hypothetical protein